MRTRVDAYLEQERVSATLAVYPASPNAAGETSLQTGEGFVSRWLHRQEAMQAQGMIARAKNDLALGAANPTCVWQPVKLRGKRCR